ncbi:MAG: hypothetical protein MJ245_01085 [Clostridia bacterium]|nr:hypothetical protein [Clostridia bacterium]
MELIRVNIDSVMPSNEFAKEIKDIIIDAGKTGLLFKGYVPTIISPVGKITSYELIFDYYIDPIGYSFETIEADSGVLSYLKFNGIKELIEKHDDDDEGFCGFCPVRTGPSNRLSEILLVFANC